MLLLLVGCAGNTAKKHTIKSISQQARTEVVVSRSSGKFYRVPKYTFSSRSDKVWYEKNKIVTSGLLDCPIGNTIAISKYERTKFVNANKKYRDILTPKELKEFNTIPKRIPKKNSQEYKELTKEMTAIYRRGNMLCIKPMNKTEVKKYKAYLKQQEKINSDPRVVAARINAQAAQQRQLMQYAEYNRARKAQSMQSMTNSLNQFSNNMVARQPVRVDVNVNHSYGNDHTYQVNTGL